MKTHSNMASRILGILSLVAVVGWLQPTAAYGQTAENTVIINTATVSFSDANSNTYSTVDGVANVTVGGKLFRPASTSGRLLLGRCPTGCSCK